MASSSAYLFTATLPRKKSRFCQPFQFRAQSHRDEGRSSDIVDTNLSVLRERMRQVKIKEKLERWCRAEPGWNYAPVQTNFKSKRDEELLHQFLQLLGMVAATFGLTLLSCISCLCIISFLVHLNQ